MSDPVRGPAQGPTRERILGVAADLFARRGYHGTSTRAIAEAVGIRQPSVFHHFVSKSEIMKVLLDSALEGVPTGVAAGAEGSPAERLARLALALVHPVPGTRLGPLSLLDDDVLQSGEFAHWRAVAEALRADLRRLLREGTEAGELVDVDPALAERALEGCLASPLRALPAEGHDPEDAAVLGLRMLLSDPGRTPEVMAAARSV